MDPERFARWMQDPDRPALVMGVLNVTPDSFSDGGKYHEPAAAIARAEALCADGADLLDVGGESTRPGSARVEAREQIRRILPVIQGIAGRLPALISVDTTRSEVARAALEHGAAVINDISAARDDPAMLELAAKAQVPLILMHMKGEPATMQQAPFYRDVVEEVAGFLGGRMAAAEEAGVSRSRILLDPGIGFGKSFEHNLRLLRDLQHLTRLGRPLVLGTSRKGFIGRITGESEPGNRLFGTAASVAWTVTNGASIVRVHDVGPMARVVRLIRAIQSARVPPAAP